MYNNYDWCTSNLNTASKEYHHWFYHPVGNLPRCSSPHVDQMFLNWIKVSTCTHLKWNSCRECADIWGPLSLASLCIIPYTLRPIGCDVWCTWTSILDYMASSGLRCCWWNQSAPPSASHLYARLGVVWGMERYHCHSTLATSLLRMLYSARLGGYFSLVWSCVLPNLSMVAWSLALTVSLPSEFDLHMAAKTSPPTAEESIQDYPIYPMLASPCMLQSDLQLLSPSAAVHLEAVSNGSTPGFWTNAVAWETQSPVLSSSCWTNCSWPAPSFWQIAWRRFWFASGKLGVCPLHRPSPINCLSHHPHYICSEISPVMAASPDSLRHLISTFLQAATCCS